MSTRLEKLQELFAQDSGNLLLRYGIAQELANAGRLEESVKEYQALAASHPDYSPAYFHGARTLERMGRIDDARRMYTQGIEAAGRAGDLHARQEMEAALASLGVSPGI